MRESQYEVATDPNLAWWEKTIIKPAERSNKKSCSKSPDSVSQSVQKSFLKRKQNLKYDPLKSAQS